jgi:hypothetical protein
MGPWFDGFDEEWKLKRLSLSNRISDWKGFLNWSPFHFRFSMVGVVALDVHPAL